MALERLILGSNRKRYDYVATGMNVLKNLVSLIKYVNILERNCVDAHYNILTLTLFQTRKAEHHITFKPITGHYNNN